MKKTRHTPLILLLLILVSVSFSCGDTAPTQEARLLDSLNQRAYAYRYKNLDSSYQAALKAYQNAKLYGQGKAEACNNLGFCAFMRMDFDGAERYHKEALEVTSNELERLIADVGLMKVYQRTSMNKEYYDYRNSAIRRMKRINEDITVFVAAHERLRLNYAYTEFYIVSAIYYYYLQQKPEAVQCMDSIQLNDALKADTNQLLYYYYIKGSAGLSNEKSFARKTALEFDDLFSCWLLSSQNDYLYFMGNSLQGIAEMLIDSKTSNVLYNRRMQALQLLNTTVVPDSLLPLELARRALQIFKQYEDVYQIAGTYRTIGTYLNEHGRYREALDSLSRALTYVNKHHELYYHCLDTTDRLKPFIAHDSVFAELTWINQDDIKTVPEWIARIREQLSVAYAGLGLKVASDYNRNIYLDILDYTRQDKELESRYLSLEKESKQLNVLLSVVLIGFVLLIILFWFFNRRWKIRNGRHIGILGQTLEICQKITASIPADATCADEISSSIETFVLPDLEKLFHAVSLRIVVWDEDECQDADIENDMPDNIKSEFNLIVPDKEHPIGKIELYTRHKLSKDERALMKVIVPYIAWTLDNGLTFISLGDQRRRLEKQRYVYEQHIADNKRQNLIKKACMSIVSGINPYMDRIINEVHKLTAKGYINDEQIKSDKYQYIDELITKINEYNDILALWIKMKQGSLSLNIENFQLNDLFEVLAKGRKNFEMKHQTFKVEAVDAIVKADKALTLFMINTLTENARKYTPEGGTISLFARNGEDYVEISVEDTGRGLSEEDVTRILGEKVYDSRQIGVQLADDAEELKKSKGSGFGLMNCKGIIEKYRKTNEVFKVCSFNIESIPGKGSRFFFRLPKGVRKTLGILLLFVLPCFFTACTQPDQNSKLVSINELDSITVAAQEEYDELLDEAACFADSAYYCNIMGDYLLTLQYVDSAMMKLNAHYVKYSAYPRYFMMLTGEDTPAEIFWWKRGFDSDYRVIQDIRNEAAVAYLALKQLDGYRYNNEAYTMMYKILGEDNSLDDYCRKLQQSTNNKIVGIILCGLLLLIIIVGYYILYARRRLQNRQNLEQVFEINHLVFASSMVRKQDADDILQIPSRVIDRTFDAINEIQMIDMLGLAVFDEDKHELRSVFNPRLPELREEQGETDAKVEILKALMRRCFETSEYVASADSTIQCFPLLVDVGDTHSCVGVLILVKPEGVGRETDRLLFELVARYMGIVVFNAVVKLANKYRDIESAQDDTLRASWEDGQLHVQNMVLDNCLSTIKHETIYYPNKIKQIIDKLNSGRLSSDEEKENVDTIAELVSYYKDIFTILSSCAARQLEEVTFRRTTVKVNDLIEHAQKYLKKANKKNNFLVQLYSESSALKVTGDEIQLKFLLESLIDEALSYRQSGSLELLVREDGEFVRFLFTDLRRNKTMDELNQLFYPDLARMTDGEEGKLSGTEYLICKQIIRDHDEFAGRRGCRINAEPSTDGGFTVYFTIPKR